jgi:aryl-alcohol dehydrogenase-like predicted oxidoreductase
MLGVPFLFGIMLHREEMQMLLGKGLSNILSGMVKSGRVRYAGVSVYSPEKALQALEEDCIDIIQLPSNILDRRFERAGVFEFARKKGKKVYIRSVFLQGLLLMDYDKIPVRLAGVKKVIQQLDSMSAETGMTRQELALGYIKTEIPDAKIVFGADTPEQVKKNSSCWQTVASNRRVKDQRGIQ